MSDLIASVMIWNVTISTQRLSRIRRWRGWWGSYRQDDCQASDHSRSVFSPSRICCGSDWNYFSHRWYLSGEEVNRHLYLFVKQVILS